MTIPAAGANHTSAPASREILGSFDQNRRPTTIVYATTFTAYLDVRWLPRPSKQQPQPHRRPETLAPWRPPSRSSSQRLRHRAPTSSTSRRKSRRTESRFSSKPKSPHRSRSKMCTSYATRATGTCARSTRGFCSFRRACSASRAKSRTARR